MSLPTSQDFPRVETLSFLLNSPPPLVMEAELSKVKAPNWDEIEILVCKKAAYEVSTSNGIVKKGSLAQQTADCYRRHARLLCGPGGLQPWVDRPESNFWEEVAVSEGGEEVIHGRHGQIIPCSRV